MSADLSLIEDNHNTIETAVARSKPKNPYGDSKKDLKQKNKSALPAYDSINNSNILVDGEVSFAMDTKTSGDKLVTNLRARDSVDKMIIVD